MAQVLGILGAGQLGRMLALAGYPLGFVPSFYDSSAGEAVRELGSFTKGSFEDEQLLSSFVERCDLLTYEFENVPVEAAKIAEEKGTLYPPSAALKYAQDRKEEKELFAKLGMALGPWTVPSSEEELSGQKERPRIIKTRRLGYDGKGQYRFTKNEELRSLALDFSGQDYIVEDTVEFQRELSIVAVRDPNGQKYFYPLTENEHVGGILRFSLAPARVSKELETYAQEMAAALMDHLEYVGVLAIEFFDTGATLLANEFAPRVHNSGHWTMDGADTSQFENHLRAVAGLPIGSCAAAHATLMVNVLGSSGDSSQIDADFQNVVSKLFKMSESAHMHLYDKSVKAGRKLAHLNYTAASLDEIRSLLSAAKEILLQKN